MRNIVKQLIIEGIQEKAAESFIKDTIQNTEFENKVYAVGGYVRDFVLGLDAKDLDIVVDYPNGGIVFADWITKKIGNYKHGSNPVIFPRFLTAQFNFNGIVYRGIDLTGYKIESVAPRSEEYLDPTSRKPEVKQSDLKGDSLRRDLSINALYKNISTGEIIDPSKMGISDIKNKILRPAGDPDKVYSEDALRLLRIIRFYAKFDYKIPLNIIRSIKRNAPKLNNISNERISDELNKMLLTSSPDKAIKALKVTGLLKYVIPELLPLVRLAQNKYHKEDAFKHTLSVLSRTQPDLVTRLMGLFHDIGKATTKSVDPETGGVHFYGHEMDGERITDEVMTRMKYPRELIDAVKIGVRNHMRMKSAGDTGVKISDKALLKFRNEMGIMLPKVLNLMHADNTSHADAASMPNQIRNLEARISTLKDIPKKPKMPISGNDLIASGLKPGPLFKEIMAAVLDAWYANPKLSRNESLEIARRMAQSARDKGQV